MVGVFLGPCGPLRARSEKNFGGVFAALWAPAGAERGKFWGGRGMLTLPCNSLAAPQAQNPVAEGEKKSGGYFTPL